MNNFLRAERDLAGISASKTLSTTKTITKTISSTKTPTATKSFTKTSSVSKTPQKSITPSVSSTITDTASPTESISESSTSSDTLSITATFSTSRTPSLTMTTSHTISATKSSSFTPSFSTTHSNTPSPMPSPPIECNSGNPLYAWQAGMYNRCSEVNFWYQKVAFEEGLVNEDQALQITTYIQYFALHEGIPFEQALLVQDAFNISALKAGADMEMALKVTNYGQYQAILTNLDSHQRHLYFFDNEIEKITNDIQVEVFKTTDLSLDQALLFNSISQLQTYLLGYNEEDALKITTSIGYLALLDGMTIDEAAQVYIWFQVAAYRCCHNAQEALTVTNGNLLMNYTCSGETSVCYTDLPYIF
jgi:hypothetical protein